MKPIIYQIPFSPFCVSLMRALEAAGVEFEAVEVFQWDRSRVIELTQGAYYQVPVMEYGDMIVFETEDDPQCVPHFVDSTFLGGKLFPVSEQGLHDILIRYLENDVEEISFRLADPDRIQAISDLVARTMVISHKERKFGKGCVEHWAMQKEEILSQTIALLHPLELRLHQSRFLLTENAPVYADFLLYGLTVSLEWHNSADIPECLPALRRHRDEMESITF